MVDQVTGARTEVELTVGVAPEKFWEIVADVTRIGEFSPECKAAAWLDADSPGPGSVRGSPGATSSGTVLSAR